MDAIKFRILEDGTIEVTTPGISAVNHVSADKLLKGIESALGGQTVARKRERAEIALDLSGHLAAHAHDGHAHVHEG